MYYVYILRSHSSGRYYIGQTQDIEERLIYHNNNRVRSTRQRGPWEIADFIRCGNRSEAVRLERKLKSFKDGDYALEYLMNLKETEVQGFPNSRD